MAEKLLMLALSPTMEKGTIVHWRKAEGDSIEPGDVLCEVETDKTTMDYETDAEGILLKILTPEGREAGIGQAIAIIGEAGEDISGLLADAVAAPPPATESGPTESRSAPVAAEPEDETAPVSSDERGAVDGHREDRVKASPLARKLARDSGLDLSRVTGSGPGGRVIKRDVEAVLAGETVPTAPSVPAAAPSRSAAVGDRTIPVSAKRRVIASRLAQSKFAAPHYYLKISARMDGLLEARRRLNTGRESRVSLNAFLVKLAAEVLVRHPLVNASWNGETITLHGAVDIGLAVAQPDGLITPVIRDCARKGIMAIDEEITALVDKARANRLTPEEYTGATFTISNLGSFGIEEFTAIINPPGSAILALGAVRREPVALDDEHLEIQSLMRMTMSCDHRIVDGAVGAAFLKDLKEMIEDPVRALY